MKSDTTARTGTAARAAGPRPDHDTATVPARRSPWVVGIIIGFIIVVLVNIGFIYVAVKGADRVDPGYHTEGR